MRLFHRRTKVENLHLLWQSLIVFVIMFTFMYFLKKVAKADAILSAIGATSIGSSAFLAFVAHDTAMARARRMIWGYLFGLVIGMVCSFTLRIFLHCNDFECAATADGALLFAAAAAFFTMLAMTYFSCEHPPAVGIAIGLVLWDWQWPVLVVVFGAVLTIALLKRFLRPWLLNLL